MRKFLRNNFSGSRNKVPKEGEEDDEAIMTTASHLKPDDKVTTAAATVTSYRNKQLNKKADLNGDNNKFDRKQQQIISNSNKSVENTSSASSSGYTSHHHLDHGYHQNQHHQHHHHHLQQQQQQYLNLHQQPPSRQAYLAAAANQQEQIGGANNNKMTTFDASSMMMANEIEGLNRVPSSGYLVVGNTSQQQQLYYTHQRRRNRLRNNDSSSSLGQAPPQPPMVPMMIDDDDDEDDDVGVGVDDMDRADLIDDDIVDDEDDNSINAGFHRRGNHLQPTYTALQQYNNNNLHQHQHHHHQHLRRHHSSSQAQHTFGEDETNDCVDSLSRQFPSTDHRQHFAATHQQQLYEERNNHHHHVNQLTTNRPIPIIDQSLLYQPANNHHNSFTYLDNNNQQYHQLITHQHSLPYSSSLSYQPSSDNLQYNYNNNFVTANQKQHQTTTTKKGKKKKMQQQAGSRQHLTSPPSQVDHQSPARHHQQQHSSSKRKQAPGLSTSSTSLATRSKLNKRKFDIPKNVAPSLGFCGKLAKLLLFIANILFWLAGIALGAWGILALVDDHKYNLSQLLVFEPNSRMSLFQLLSWSFITLGCATVLVGFCGCSAILKNNRWILGLYIFLILAIFALDLATGLLAIIFQERLVANVRLRLGNKLRTEYGVHASFTAAIDYIQTRYECCGLEGHFDYDQSLWRLQRLGGFEATVARTCCHLRNTFDDQAHINPRPLNESMCQSTDVRFHQSYRYRKGCLDDLERLVRFKIWNFTIGCAAVGAIILLSLFFATCFCRSIPQSQSRKSSSGEELNYQQEDNKKNHGNVSKVANRIDAATQQQQQNRHYR